MQHFVDGFVAQCMRHNLRAELILVEWNPPTDRPPLVEELRWPKDTGPCDIRIITVPPNVHQTFEHSDKLPLFQMIAKNVGIRQARGKFVLATNIDILFSDESIIYMRDNLRKGCLYRADRLDVPTDVLDCGEFKDILDYCWREYFRINTNQYTATRKGKEWLQTELWLSRIKPNYRDLILRLGTFPNLIWTIKAKLKILFLCLAQGLILKLSSFAKLISKIKVNLQNLSASKVLNNNRPRNAPIIYLLTKLQNLFLCLAQGLILKLKSFPKLISKIKVNLQNLSASNAPIIYLLTTYKKFAHKFICILNSRAANLVALIQFVSQMFTLQRLHTNACGDFTLLAYDDWMALRGYPEWAIFSWHIDSVFLYQSFNSNLKEIYLGYSAPVFHIEHVKGSGYTPEGADALFTRLRAIKLPYLSNPDFTRIVEEQKHRKIHQKIISYNGPNWGLQQYTPSSNYISQN